MVTVALIQVDLRDQETAMLVTVPLRNSRKPIQGLKLSVIESRIKVN